MTGSHLAASFTPAQRVQRIKASPSTVAAARVRELKAAGEQIFDFTVGQPDFDTPQHIQDAATRAMAAGETRYTSVNGTVELRAAIRQRMQRTSGIAYPDESVTIGGGAKQVIYLAFSATLDAHDEVIIPTPYWVSYPDMVAANDGTPVIVQTKAEDRYKITPEQLRAAITERTRWLILNSPSNPTGVAYTKAELQALAAVLEEVPHVWVLTDEIYDDITFGPEPLVGLAEVAPSIRSRVLTVNGVSKSYAMTGWRLGYAVGDPALIGAINLLQSQVSTCPSSVSQAAAVAALTGDQTFVHETVRAYRERRDRALDLINTIDGLHPIEPDGAFYLFVDCAGLIGRRTPQGQELTSDQDVTLYLLEEAGVAVIQGSAFGAEPFFRMSFATDLDTIEAGVAAISEAVAQLT